MRSLWRFRTEFPPLVVGKGPSFANIHKLDLSQFTVITLNQAALESPKVDVAHFIDYEPFIECHDVVYGKDIWMPFMPHWREAAGHGNINEFLRYDKVLQHADKHEKLWLYNFAGESDRKEYPKTEQIAFSSAIVFNLLGILGCKHVHSVGIDGGMDRHGSFKYSYRKNEVSYSIQDSFIEMVLTKFEMKWTKL